MESTPFIVRSRKRCKNNAKDRNSKNGSARKQVKVTVSIGLASPAGQMSDPEKVIKEADKKLYKAKKSGRNRTAY
jgi:diguanylate cyclase (GGDEF)-like protein